jgi:hypothetical protein
MTADSYQHICIEDYYIVGNDDVLSIKVGLSIWDVIWKDEF